MIQNKIGKSVVLVLGIVKIELKKRFINYDKKTNSVPTISNLFLVTF